MSKKQVKNILLCAFGLLLFAVSLALWIQSKDNYGGAYNYDTATGKTIYEYDVEFNMDYVISMIVGVAIVAYAGYLIYTEIKGGYDAKYYSITASVSSVLVSLYGFGTFFKALVKAQVNGNEFVYAAYQVYLYVGILALAYASYIIISYFASKEK